MNPSQNSSMDARVANDNVLDAQEFEYQVAQKTKPIKAKATNSIINDESVFAKFVLDTLEGTQALRAGSMTCIGIVNDVWQQDEKKLFDKYEVVGCDAQGWMQCEPKPDVPVNAHQVPEWQGDFAIVNPKWGDEQIVDGKQGWLQYGKGGDYVCQNPDDPSDVWIVRKAFFDNTYEIE